MIRIKDKKTALLMALLIAFVCLFFINSRAYADQAGVPDSIPEHYKVFDEDRLIENDSERAALEQELAKIYEKYKVNAYIILTTNIGMSDDYEGYLERKWTALPDRNSVILLIGFKSDDHVYIIRSFGEENAEKKLSTKRLQKVQDDMEADMRNYNFYEAGNIFAKDIYKYLGSYDSVYDDVIFLKWWFQLLILFAIFAVIFLVSALNSGGKDEITPSTYLNTGKSRVVNGFDRYVRTTVSRVKIQSDSGSRGGGGGFSGGGGHSSGGRGF
jgi:Beta-propeller domains of methanol dehydrogenase type